MSFAQNSLATILAEGARTRSSWNDRLTHWERPASDSEEVHIQRAASMVRFALTENTWLRNEGVAVSAQGSYFNNTNVRLESDMDLRAVHPLIRIIYANDVLVTKPFDGGQDVVGGFGPAKGLGVGIAGVDVGGDGGLQRGGRAVGAA